MLGILNSLCYLLIWKNTSIKVSSSVIQFYAIKSVLYPPFSYYILCPQITQPDLCNENLLNLMDEHNVVESVSHVMNAEKVTSKVC